MFKKDVDITFICKCDKCGVEYRYTQEDNHPPTREKLMNEFGFRRTMGGEDVCPCCFEKYIKQIGGNK